MENITNTTTVPLAFIKTDANKHLNEHHIKWIKPHNDCIEVCMKYDGCIGNFIDTHKISKLYNPDSYNKLKKYYDCN